MLRMLALFVSVMMIYASALTLPPWLMREMKPKAVLGERSKEVLREYCRAQPVRINMNSPSNLTRDLYLAAVITEE